ncbi:putative UTP--glucose-1-phosphate uridylyltransferase [Venturia inaequalis]|nr:putative UTP--glucose-1-phosphate uridylyltransferase [Venturia inaequalis]
MAELVTPKLDHETHLLLDQPLLRLPYEFSRTTFKSAQQSIDLAQKKVNESVQSGTKAAAAANPSNDPSRTSTAAINSLDQAITRLQTLKRKLSTLNNTTVQLQRQSAARIRHLDDMYQIPTLVDVKYEEWSKIRLDRLLVDYLLRMGYTKSARELAQVKNIELLVDVDAFEAMGKIETSLSSKHQVDPALTWCTENKANLKKMENNNLEYELRLQQHIELCRTGHEQGDYKKLDEARLHASKYFRSHPDQEWKNRASGLLVIPPSTNMDPYHDLYSPSRWNRLSKLFLTTHHEMYSLPKRPLLHMALEAGLSALKTPACHSKHISPSSGYNSTTSPAHSQNNGALSPIYSSAIDDIMSTIESANNINSMTTSVCPICSTELNQLSRHLPFGHHSKSHTEHDPVVLPNGRIYGRERLERMNEKIGTQKGYVKDPVDTTNIYLWSEVKKVFIS